MLTLWLIHFQGVPVPVIVNLFQQALEHCLLVLKKVAIPLDISKLNLQQTANNWSAAVQENRVKPQRLSTAKQKFACNSVLGSSIVKSISTPESNHFSSVCREHVNSSEINAALHSETENGNENESFDVEEDVSWFFDSQVVSDPLNFNLPGIECSITEQVKNRSFLEDKSVKMPLGKTKSFVSHASKESICSDEYKLPFEIKSKPKHSVPENTVVSNQDLVIQRINWKRAGSYSAAVSSSKQMYGKTEPMIRLHNVDLSEHLATLFQKKEKSLKPRLNSFSKYSRSIFCNEFSQDTHCDSSDTEFTSFRNDTETSRQNCEPTDSTSDDEFSSCFDNIPFSTENALEASHVSSSNTPNKKLLNMKTKPKRSGVDSKYLLQEVQNDIGHTSAIQMVSKYSRLVTDVKTSGNEAQENVTLPSPTSNESLTDFETQRIIKHHARHQTPSDTVSSLNVLGKRLNHGREKEMDLAVEVVQTQIKYKGEELSTEIESKSIHVETIVGPSSLESRVVDGLVIEVDDVDINLIKDTSGKPLSFILVNGDITPQFRHPGFNNATAIKQILHTESAMKKLKNDSEVWFERIKETLSKFGIDVVIVKGVVEDMVADYCKSMGILVIQKVMPSKLQVLSINFGVPLVMYLTNIRATEIGGPVTVDVFESGWTPLKYRKPSSKFISTTFRKMIFVVLRNVFRCEKPVSSNLFPLQTVIIAGPSKDIACDSEMCFWSCFHSLKNAIYCKKILPGAGSSERACIQELERLKHQGNFLTLPAMMIKILFTFIISFIPATFYVYSFFLTCYCLPLFLLS